MRVIVVSGVALGALISAWVALFATTGLYRHPSAAWSFQAVTAIQVVVLVFGLRKTAALGRTYWGQVRAGALMSIVGGAVVAIGTLLLMTVVAPHFLEDVRRLEAERLAARGVEQAEIAARMAAAARIQTPGIQAIVGFLGTVATGFVASLVIGAFIRARGDDSNGP